MEHKLKYPIKTDEGGEKTVLKIKDRIKGADLLVLDEAKGDVERSLKLIARMCQISSYEAEQLDSVDVSILADILAKKQEG